MQWNAQEGVRQMQRTRGNRRGQTFVEYALVFSLVIAAVLLMGTYFKRGWNARAKMMIDAKPETTALSGVTLGKALNQYDPYYVENDMTTAQASEGRGLFDKGNFAARDLSKITQQGSTTETGYKNITGWADHWDEGTQDAGGP